MNIVLVYGSDVKKVNDRVAKFVDSAKKRNWEIVRINKKDNVLLSETLTQDSLFAKGKLFVVENFKILSKKDSEWINSHKKADYTLIIQNDGEVKQTEIKKIPFTKIEKYNVDVNVFKFSDSFIVGNAKNCLKYLNELKQKEPMELIIAILSRQLLDLYRINKGYKIKAPSWKKSFLEKTAEEFGEVKIREMIKELSDIDYNSKIGKVDSGFALDLFIAKYLQTS